MENLLRFLIKSSSFLLFLLLEIVSISLIVSHNNYHQSVFLSSANVVIGNIYETVNEATAYFDLNRENALLSRENNALKNKNSYLLKKLADLNPNAIKTDSTSANSQFKYIEAKVINSSVNKQQNYITLNRGSLSGIKPDMGVINAKGVVGIVSTVSKNFSVVIPILNPRAKISCRLDSSKYFGSLVWEGKSPSYGSLEEIPHHVKIFKNEAIRTSGFSAIFPEGILVGTIRNFDTSESNSFYNIKVKLAVNFQNLSYVNVVYFENKKELTEIEKSLNP